jgi:dihydroorotate dehydrogenase
MVLGNMMLFDRPLPLLRRLPPETAHRATIAALRLGLAPRRPAPDAPSLAIKLWGREFPNPIGLAAGFDKDAEVPDAMLRFGFGFVEIGTVTPRPQPGNPRPRLFRLGADAALINRLGFNSGGLPAVVTRLAARRGRGGLVGANIGKNRDTLDDIADYVQGVTALARHADYLAVNVSSPNTPGLRALQRKSVVVALIERLMAARASVRPDNPPPLLLKIAPDLSPEERADLASAALATRIDGMVIANTTVARPPTLVSAEAHEPGGLSGKPLFAPSTALLAEMYRLTGGKLPLIGVGGIASGADAYEKIRAGASLVQLYTALVYQGAGLVPRIKQELTTLLARDGFATLAAAVGSAAHSPRAPAHGH